MHVIKEGTTSFRIEGTQAKIITLGKKQVLAKQCLQFLYSEPITDTVSIAKRLEVSFATASRLVQDFQKLEILYRIHRI